MGQLQLLLLIFVSIILGVVILAGMGQFDEGLQAAFQDEMRKRMFDTAARAQAWYRSPVEHFGGRSFTNFSLAKIHCDSSSLAGVISLSNKQANSFRLTGALHQDSNWRLIVDVYPDSIIVWPFVIN
jgi:hypothetical protein